MKKQGNRGSWWRVAVILAAALTVFRILLYLTTPIAINSDQVYDDRLLYDYAVTLSHGDWLGAYNSLTLVKGFSYSLLMAVWRRLFIPYMLGFALFNIFAAFVFYRAIRPRVNKFAALFFYILLIFAPITFATLVTQRTYRNSILPASAMLLFASFIGLFLRRDRTSKQNWKWLLIASVSLVFFWFIKEDSIWVLPFVVTISVLTIIYYFIGRKKERGWLKKSIAFIIPLFVLIFSQLAVSAVNYAHYGLFLASDKSGGEFSEMIKNLMAVDNGRSEDENIWVSGETLTEIYRVSPTFSEIEDNINNIPTWYTGDLIVWRVRAAMDMNGLYRDAKTADDWCGRVNDELTQAFSDGRLKKTDKLILAAQMRPVEISEIFGGLGTSMVWAKEYSEYQLMNVTNMASSVLDQEDYNSHYAFFSSYAAGTDETAFPFERSQTYKIAKKFVSLYQKLAPIFNVAAAAGFILWTVVMACEFTKKRFRMLELWLVVTGLFLSAAAVLFVVSMFTGFFDKEMLSMYRTFYSASALPLISMTKYLSIYMLGAVIASSVNKRRK